MSGNNRSQYRSRSGFKSNIMRSKNAEEATKHLQDVEKDNDDLLGSLLNMDDTEEEKKVVKKEEPVKKRDPSPTKPDFHKKVTKGHFYLNFQLRFFDFGDFGRRMLKMKGWLLGLDEAGDLQIGVILFEILSRFEALTFQNIR